MRKHTLYYRSACCSHLRGNFKIAQKSRTSSGSEAELLEAFLDVGHDGRNSIAGDRGTRSKLEQNSSVGVEFERDKSIVRRGIDRKFVHARVGQRTSS